MKQDFFDSYMLHMKNIYNRIIFFLMLSQSSNHIRLLPIKPKQNIYLSSFNLRASEGLSARQSNKIVRNSIQNCSRIHMLSKKLKQTSDKFQLQMEEMHRKEDQVCQIELFQKMYEGPFSTVYRVRIKQSGKHYALKKIIIDQDHESRQERICRIIRSNFLVKIIDVYSESYNMKPKLNILMELYDWNLKQYIKSDEAIEPLTFKALCYQMVRSLLYLHSKSICHRDVKPDNFLMKKTGRIVLSDFGSAKFMKANEQSLGYISSRSYRAPQLLLGLTNYTTAVDIWALACVFVEMLTRRQIFCGSSSIDCLLNMGRIVGTKDIKKIRGSEQASKLLPNIKGFGLNEYLSKRTSTHLIDLLSKMLRVNPADRIEAVDVLVHPYFDELRDDQAYQEIMKEKFDISDFFDFSSIELKTCEEYKTKLIPSWKRGRPDRRING